MTTIGNYRKLAMLSMFISVSGIIFMFVGIAYYFAGFLTFACYVVNTPLSMIVWWAGTKSIERDARAGDESGGGKKTAASDLAREKLERERRMHDYILIISLFSVFAYMFLVGVVIFAIRIAVGVPIPVNPGMAVSIFLLATMTCTASSYRQRSKFISRMPSTAREQSEL